MIYCMQCGKELNDDAVFCTECGNRLKPPDSPEPVQIETTEAACDPVMSQSAYMQSEEPMIAAHIEDCSLSRKIKIFVTQNARNPDTLP